MVLLTAAAALTGLVLTYFAVGAVATVAHWVAVAAAFTAGAGLAYHLLDGDLAEYFDVVGFTEGSLFQVLSAGVIGSVAGFIVFRLLESVFAAAGLTGALLLGVLVAAGFVFGPVTVVSYLAAFVDVLFDVFGGEN